MNLQNPKHVPQEAVQEVFDHWVRVCRSGKGPQVILSDKRERCIRRAIADYGIPTCLDAINGVLKSPFHQGENARGKKYDEITLILRDSEHIEDFARLAYESSVREQFIKGIQ